MGHLQPGPIILTTRSHWKEDSTPEINTLMTVRQQDVLEVRFRPESPRFLATIALDALDDPRTAAGFLTTLRIRPRVHLPAGNNAPFCSLSVTSLSVRNGLNCLGLATRYASSVTLA